jgi:hypothetical protein
MNFQDNVRWCVGMGGGRANIFVGGQTYFIISHVL